MHRANVRSKVVAASNTSNHSRLRFRLKSRISAACCRPKFSLKPLLPGATVQTIQDIANPERMAFPVFATPRNIFLQCRPPSFATDGVGIALPIIRRTAFVSRSSTSIRFFLTGQYLCFLPHATSPANKMIADIMNNISRLIVTTAEHWTTRST